MQDRYRQNELSSAEYELDVGGVTWFDLATMYYTKSVETGVKDLDRPR